MRIYKINLLTFFVIQSRLKTIDLTKVINKINKTRLCIKNSYISRKKRSRQKSHRTTAVLQDAEDSLQLKQQFVLAEYNLKLKLTACRVPHLAKPQNVGGQLKMTTTFKNN